MAANKSSATSLHYGDLSEEVIQKCWEFYFKQVIIVTHFLSQKVTE